MSPVHRTKILDGRFAPHVAGMQPRWILWLRHGRNPGTAGCRLYTCLPAVQLFDVPSYFVVYAVAVIAACSLAAGGIALRRDPSVARTGWYSGTFVLVVGLVLDVGAWLASLPGWVAVTGRSDVASATFELALAGALMARSDPADQAARSC